MFPPCVDSGREKATSRCSTCCWGSRRYTWGGVETQQRGDLHVRNHVLDNELRAVVCSIVSTHRQSKSRRSSVLLLVGGGCSALPCTARRSRSLSIESPLGRAWSERKQRGSGCKNDLRRTSSECCCQLLSQYCRSIFMLSSWLLVRDGYGRTYHQKRHDRSSRLGHCFMPEEPGRGPAATSQVSHRAEHKAETSQVIAPTIISEPKVMEPRVGHHDRLVRALELMANVGDCVLVERVAIFIASGGKRASSSTMEYHLQKVNCRTPHPVVLLRSHLRQSCRANLVLCNVLR